MSLKEYLKDNLRYFVLWLLMLGIIDFFLIMFKITSSLIWIITIVILSSMIIIVSISTNLMKKMKEYKS